MKDKNSFSLYKVLRCLKVRFVFLAFIAGILSAVPVMAQDVIETPAQVFRGKVKSADKESVVIEMLVQGRSQEITIPRNIIRRLSVEPPPSVLAGIEAYEAGNWRQSKLNLERIILNYQGLDVDWAQKGMLYFGRASMRSDDYVNAERAFKLFLDSYPNHPLAIEARLGQADVEREKGNYEAAIEFFRNLVESYDAQLRPAGDEMVYAAEAYMGIGKSFKDQNEPRPALDAFVRIMALYPVEQFYPEALYRAAVVSSDLGQFKNAENYLAELIKEYPATQFAREAIALRSEVQQKIRAAADKK